MDDDTLQSKLEEVVDDLLNLSVPARDQVVSYVRLICDRLDTNAGVSLTKNQNQRIKAFAGRKGHRCYICGQRLTYEETVDNSNGNGVGRDTRAFEVDHIFPQSRGGGRGTDNLAACCNACNKIKGHRVASDQKLPQPLQDERPGVMLGQRRLAALDPWVRSI